MITHSNPNNKFSRRFYASDKTIQNLMKKAEQNGFVGRGSLSNFLEYIAQENVYLIRVPNDFKIIIKDVKLLQKKT